MARKDEEKMPDWMMDLRDYGYMDSYRGVPVALSSSLLTMSSNSCVESEHRFSDYGSQRNGMKASTKASGNGDDLGYYGREDAHVDKKEKREGKALETTIEKGMGKMEILMGMETETETKMQTSIDQKTKSEPENSKENSEIPLWLEEVDRFTNYLIKSDISALSLISTIKEILEQVNMDPNLWLSSMNDYDHDHNHNNSSKENADTNVLTHICYGNIFRCRLVLNAYTVCTFNIGVYRYGTDNCLLDIQELSGDHLTFSHFLYTFKLQLQKQQIIQESTFTPEFMDNYGLGMEIDLESFN